MADFGIDLDCAEDLVDSLGVVSGRTLYVQACVRAITTPRGRLIDDVNWGIDVRDWVNEGVTADDVISYGPQVDAELVKDPRTLSSTTTPSLVGGKLGLNIALEDADGPFTLVLAVDAVSVTVLEVT